jgi:hypothetical protein
MIKNALRLVLALSLLALAPATALAFPPANDAPSNAVAIPAAPAFVSGTTVEGTLDADEPSPLVAADDGGTRHGLDRSVWFTYRPEKDIKILADTCDANFTSHIDVYTGGPGGFGVVETKVNSYRDCPGDRRSFAARAGTLYWIRVSTERDGVRFPDGGNFHLRLTPQTAPLDDAFSDATPLSATGTFPGSLAFASLELGEPSYREDTGSVWYRLTPAAGSAYVASVGASPTTVTLQVFESRGSTINRLRRLGQDYTEDDYTATVAFNALKGKTYYIRLGTSSQVPSPTSLQLTTNTAQGLGLLVTPASNTLASLRHDGFKAVLSCARACTLGVDLLVSPADARRYHLTRKTPKAPVKVGHIGGTLQPGQPTSVTIPLSASATRKLLHATSLHTTLRVSVRGRRGTTTGRPVTKTTTLK